MVTNLFQYCGEYTDLCSGLIYLRNRYYDPSIGRFISEDPVKDGLNWYVYCGNDPVNNIDPLGTDAIYLTNKDSVPVLGVNQGHTSAVYQDSAGKWFYTYWGDKASAVIAIPSEMMGSLNDFNSALNTFLSNNGFSNITSDYTDATYVSGDFTASLRAAFSDVNTAANHEKSSGTTYTFDDGSNVYQGKNGAYIWNSNNCLQRTVASFKQGTLTDGTFVADFLVSNNFGNGIIPNNAQPKIAEMFMNTSFTKEGAEPSVLYYAQSYYTEGLATSRTKALYSYAFLGW